MIRDDPAAVGSTAPGAGNSQERLQIHSPLPPVTRVSRKAVTLFGILGASLGLVVLMLGLGDHSAPRKEGPTDDDAIRPSGPIESFRDLPKDYSFDVNRLGGGYGGLSRPSISTPATRPTRSSAQDQTLAQAMRELAEQRQMVLAQQLKEQQAALDSPLLFGGTKTATPSSAASPTTMPMRPIPGSDVHGAAEMGSAAVDTNAVEAGAGQGVGVIQNHQQEKEAFLTQAAKVEPYLAKPLVYPLSKYELKAGSLIPGALVSAIDTDLPGEVIGQVTQSVYDSVSGDYLLIPQGSKLLGKYQSLVSNGQNRALIIWQRLIYPNGNSIILDGMSGTDEAGMAGLHDQVDYHLDKIAEATVLSTAVAYAGNLARNPQSTTINGQDVIGDSVAQEANRMGEKIIDRQLDVQPTITIRQGWPLRALVNKDMVLEPYIP